MMFGVLMVGCFVLSYFTGDSWSDAFSAGHGFLFGVLVMAQVFIMYGIVKYTDSFHFWNTKTEGFIKSEK